MIEELFIDDVLGTKARYLSSGKGAPLILISGWLGTADNFVPIMEVLSDKFHCIAIDLPGLGKTTPFKDRKHTVANYVDFIDEFTKKLNEPNPTIIGVSLGASVSLGYAYKTKNKKGKIILQSPVYRPIKVSKKSLMSLRLLDTFHPLTATLLNLSSSRLFQRIIRIFGDDNIKSISFETLTKYGTTGLHNYNVTAMLDAVKDVLSFDMIDDLSEIQSPILLMCGTREGLWPKDYEGDLASRLPMCQYRIIEGGTHFLFLQKPDEVTKIISEFIQQKPKTKI